MASIAAYAADVSAAVAAAAGGEDSKAQKKEMAPVKQVVGVGVKGAGKSFLLQLMSNNQGGFGSGDGATAVTQGLCIYCLVNGKESTNLVDAPGSGEYDPKLEEMHHMNLASQVKSPNTATTWLYVVSLTNGGRISVDDIEAYKRLTDTFKAPHSSIVGAVNRYDLDGQPCTEEWCRALEAQFKEHKVTPSSWVYIPELPPSPGTTKSKYDAKDFCKRTLVNGSIWAAVNAAHAKQVEDIRERETAAKLQAEAKEAQDKAEREAAAARKLKEDAARVVKEQAGSFALRPYHSLSSYTDAAEKHAQEEAAAKKAVADAAEVKRVADEKVAKLAAEKQAELQRQQAAIQAAQAQRQAAAEVVRRAAPYPGGVKCCAGSLDDHERANPCENRIPVTVAEHEDSVNDRGRRGLPPYRNCKPYQQAQGVRDPEHNPRRRGW